MASTTPEFGQVKRSINLGEDGGRVVLYAWSACDAPRLENLVVLDPNGEVRWRAPLPAHIKYDCFVSLERRDDTIVAITWSGMATRLDAVTGVPVSRSASSLAA